MEYHKSILKNSTIKSYGYVLVYLDALFGEKSIESIKQDDVFQFMELITENQAQATKHLRFAQLKAFFNFCKNKFDLDIKNPYDSKILNKTYGRHRPKQRENKPKEIIDEIIFNAKNQRDRILMEIQARVGLRIGEVLKLRPIDIEGRKIIIRDPKSGKQSETAYMPESLANRVRDYMCPSGKPV